MLNAFARRIAAAAINRWDVARAGGARLPFSRWAPLIPMAFGGAAETTWRGARLSVDPGELEGYYRYFFPDGPDQEYDFLHDVCREAQVFFDVGANQGIYALALAKAYPRLRVVAFEPVPNLIDQIRLNVSLNPEVEGRLIVEQLAVASVSGVVRFRIATGMNSGTGAIAPGISNDGIEVAATTLDAYVQKNNVAPNVLKIDVEGAELEVLRGMRSVVHSLHAMLVELHPHAFSGSERARFQREILEHLDAVPLKWRFLVDEREWVDTLDPAREWAPRIHAFGVQIDHATSRQQHS